MTSETDSGIVRSMSKRANSDLCQTILDHTSKLDKLHREIAHGWTLHEIADTVDGKLDVYQEIIRAEIELDKTEYLLRKAELALGL